MKLPFLSKNTNTSSWPWPSCHQPSTLSFRKNDDSKNTTTMFKTIYIDAETTESSLFTNTSETATVSFSTASEEFSSGDPIETVIRGLRSERLFFEPGETSSILEEAKRTTSGFIPFKESLVFSMESQDPCIDFKKSMEEMVEAYGIKDWEDLEELLSWYLRMNVKSNHGYIVGAFVDLLVALAFASTTSSSSCDFFTCSSSSLASNTSCSPSSPLSFYTSSSDDSSSNPCCLSSLLEAEDEDEIEKQPQDDDASSS